ncbi:MAG TPA: hypothetical protein VHN99_00915, partial [Deinococcales bacterium]|nr:hypothetical protein [Deinococcales bacterium]
QAHADAQERARALRDAEKALQSARGQAAATAEKRDGERARADRLWTEAQAWLAERRLPNPRGEAAWTAALECLNDLKAARAAVEAAQAARDELAGLAALVENWNGLAQGVIRDCGLNANGCPPADAILQAAADLDASLAASADLASARTALDATAARLERAAAETQAAQERVQSLLTAAGAGDPDDFTRRAANARKRRDLLERARQAEAFLAQAAGQQAPALAERLNAADPQGWTLERERAAEETQRLQAERDANLQAETAARGDRERLERDADLPSLNQARASLVAQAQALARRYAVLSVAARLVSETLAEYEREHSPLVLRRAAETMNRVTGGRYTRLRVVANGEKRRVLVGTGDGSVIDAEKLSRGAREQLYVALRLALAAEFGGGTASLPIIMDDVLANADDERAAGTAQAVAQAARSNQVLYLTCHERTVTLLQAADPSLRLIQLPRLPQPVTGDSLDDPLGIEPDEGPADPAPGEDVTRLCDALRGRDWQARADLRALLPDWTERQHNAALSTALAAGMLERTGEKRGTRYRLAGVPA